MKGTYLGEFEELVLLTVAVLYNEAYGIVIKQELERHTGRKISIGAVHTATNRLEDKGYLSSWLGEKSDKRGGKRKKLYAVSVQGQRALQESRELRQRLWQEIPGTAFQIRLT